MKESVVALANKLFEHDFDGITVELFARKSTRYENVKSIQEIKNIFLEHEPCGGTNLQPVLRRAIDDYFSKRSQRCAQQNGAGIFVITDGSPPEKQKPMIVSDLVYASNGVQANELGICFIQVGHDKEAEMFLNYIDTELLNQGAARDIVSTLKIDDMEDSLTETLWTLIRGRQ